jgi:uncharacterized protein YjlB
MVTGSVEPIGQRSTERGKGGRQMGSAEDREGAQDIVRAVEADAHRFADDGAIPNNPTLPFLVYAGALELPRDDPAAACEAVFARNRWGGSWRDGIYSFAHYHSTAHEVLGICRGEAKVRFGGETGVVLRVRAGDVVVIPAGVGHQNLGASADLLVVGAYPRGQSWDLCGGSAAERPEALANIARVPLPTADPVYGADGPLIEHWLRRD